MNLAKELVTKGYDVSRLASGRRLILITGHRRENLVRDSIIYVML